MTCIKCKEEIPDGATFCPWCGKKQAREQRKALKRANGTGTVYKASGRRRKPWAAQKNRVLIGYFETKTAALEALDRLAGRSLTERYNMTFEEVYHEWSEEHFKEIGADGKRAYRNAFEVFSSLHKKQFRALRTNDFTRAIEKDGTFSRSSVSKYKQLITQMSKWAMREEIIETNFATFVKVPPGEAKEKETFSADDIAKLEQDGSETAKIILMLIYTGARIGELFALNVSDFHGAYVVGGSKTEAGRNRIIPIRPEGRAYFEYFVRNAKTDWLLSGYTGNKTTSGFRRLNYTPLLKKLGIKYKSPHSTRHTFASWARKNNVPPEILQKMLGHASYETTANIYVHTSVDQIIQAIDNAVELQSKGKGTLDT